MNEDVKTVILTALDVMHDLVNAEYIDSSTMQYVLGNVEAIKKAAEFQKMLYECYSFKAE